MASEAPSAKMCHSSLAIGLLLSSIALAAMRIDVLNNYDYWVQISRELAGVMVLAAIGVTALPKGEAASRRLHPFQDFSINLFERRLKPGG
jgi:hypothetical protein